MVIAHGSAALVLLALDAQGRVPEIIEEVSDGSSMRPVPGFAAAFGNGCVKQGLLAGRVKQPKEAPE